jgi:hypothetical protein
MDKHVLKFLRELFTNLFKKNTNEKLQEIFMRIVVIKKFYQLRNAIKYKLEKYHLSFNN